MRILSACSTTHELLPAVQGLFDHMSAWHDGLPQIAKASELSHTPWDESKVTLAYIHMGHLGAITLIFRRTLSMYKHTPKDQNQSLHPAERGRLAAIFNDGLVAAKQASHILYLLLGEQAGIRHCWTVMYDLTSSYFTYPTRSTAKTSSQIHRLRLLSNPALHHQPDANPQRTRSRVAAIPQPSRQRLGNPSILPRTGSSRNDTTRHSIAVHAIPANPVSRAETQSTGDMGPDSSEIPIVRAATRAATSSTPQPRYRRSPAQCTNRPRRTDPDEHRSAEISVPAVQRRHRR